MAETKTGAKRVRAEARGRRSPARMAEMSYSEALQRIREVATDALSRNDEDEAAREAHEDFVPEFKTQEEMDAWWDAQPKVKAEVDPRLLEKVKTSIRLSKLTIDGYDHLAKQMGLRSGQTLMKIVLGNYLAQSLPPDF